MLANDKVVRLEEKPATPILGSPDSTLIHRVQSQSLKPGVKPLLLALSLALPLSNT